MTFFVPVHETYCSLVASGPFGESQNGGVEATECVAMGFIRPSERMDTGDSILPRARLERGEKSGMCIKGKCRSSNSHLIFSLRLSERERRNCGFYKMVNHYPQV